MMIVNGLICFALDISVDVFSYHPPGDLSKKKKGSRFRLPFSMVLFRLLHHRHFADEGLLCS